MQKALYDFGQYIGIAFQIKDDLLDLYGESAKVGKQIGGDVLSDKKTLISIKARELGCDMLQLSSIIDSNERVRTAQQIFDDLGAKEAVENKMEEYYDFAIKSLEGIPEVQKDMYRSLLNI